MINFAGNAIMKHQNSKEKWFKLNWQNSFLQDAKEVAAWLMNILYAKMPSKKKVLYVLNDFYFHVKFCVQVSFNASWEFY